ncbi:MAG: hypothetical protein E7353_06070 [Clostridiales bacterium]|nr:hypothetical protein [Clostridiales bacterium]
MDNKLTKQRLAHHFKYDWYKYLAIAIIAVFVSIFLFDWINTTKAWERLDIFIVSNKFYDTTLKSDIKNFLDENVEDNMIREINITHITPSDPQYRDLYTSNGGSGSTILILPESEMKLTGHQVLTAVSNKYKTEGSMLDNADFFVTDYLLKDNNLLNNYFNADGSGIMDNLFAFSCESNPDRYYDDYYKGIEGNIYGFRIDNLARCPYEFYQYDEANIMYEKDENGELVLDDETGQPIPVKDRGYLVVNAHATAYTVGKYGTGSDYDDHFETFMVARFILERYYYGN